MIVGAILFFVFASFFYIKGVKKFLEQKDFFERIEGSRFFSEDTKRYAMFLQKQSISPIFGFTMMFGMIFYPLLHKINGKKAKTYRQDRIRRLVAWRFLEINTLSTPHFYVIGILALLMYLFVASTCLLLTANLKRLFNGIVSFPNNLIDDIGFSVRAEKLK